MTRYSLVERALSLAQRPFNAQWVVNPAAWPHCNMQERCWMVAEETLEDVPKAEREEPWCWCRCGWCRLARWLGSGGARPGQCVRCGIRTRMTRDPYPQICSVCHPAARGFTES